MIKILIADDHLIIRQGLRLILETEPDFELVGEASDGNEALTLCKKLKPDVVLMDLRMPNMDGLTAIEKLRVEQPEIAVVILTTFNEDELMFRGLQAGARGYLLKDTDRATLFDTIRAAARGETLLKPEIMARVLSQANAPKAVSSEPTNLTDRELEVLEKIAVAGNLKVMLEGMTGKDSVVNFNIEFEILFKSVMTEKSDNSCCIKIILVF